MSNQTVKNTKASNAVKNVHSVENLIIAQLDKVQKARQEVTNEEMNTARQHLTRIFVKRLFSCSTLEQVDGIIEDAERASDSFNEEFGDSKTRFEYRIRNAELQVRNLIKSGVNLKELNPDKSPIVCTYGHSIALADSWGHLADKFMKGYKVEVKLGK